MGRGSYTASDWANLRSSRGLIKNNAVENIFSGKMAYSAYDSRYIKIRESRDSEDSPRSTPVIIGFDVTASMGYLAKELATNAINKAVTYLYKYKPISDPHIMCAAIGDCLSDAHPLQATQFEADIRIIKQLTELYLEGGGGGNGSESYNLLWYFAAKKTKTDAYEKRKQKGFIFTIGDDRCHQQLTVGNIKKAFGDDVSYNYSNEELLEAAQVQYYVYHINIESYNSNDKSIFQSWQNFMPGYCTEIHMKDIELLAELIVSIISVTKGSTANEALKKLDQDSAERLSRSIAFIDAKSDKTNKIIF